MWLITSNTSLPRSTYQINELQANIVIAKLYCIVYTRCVLAMATCIVHKLVLQWFDIAVLNIR